MFAARDMQVHMAGKSNSRMILSGARLRKAEAVMRWVKNQQSVITIKNN